MVRTGTMRRSICSNAPRISEMSPWRSRARVNALKRSVSACRRSRWRGVNTAEPQPNRVPSAGGAKIPSSTAISHDVRGRLYPLRGRWPPITRGNLILIPAGFDETRPLAIEGDRRAIGHRRRMQTRDGAPKDAPAKSGSTMWRGDLQIDGGAWEKPLREFDQRAARGH